MKKSFSIAVLTFLILVVTLSLYDYFSLRNTQLSAGPTLPPSLVVADAPKQSSVDNPITFNWRIDSATPRVTDLTTVFWSEESSPSALTVKDSPASVGYPNHLRDYSEGVFNLPSDFLGSITLTKPQTIYYRFYAHVDGQNLWSEEYVLEIN